MKKLNLLEKTSVSLQQDKNTIIKNIKQENK